MYSSLGILFFSLALFPANDNGDGDDDDGDADVLADVQIVGKTAQPSLLKVFTIKPRSAPMMNSDKNCSAPMYAKTKDSLLTYIELILHIGLDSGRSGHPKCICEVAISLLFRDLEIYGQLCAECCLKKILCIYLIAHAIVPSRAEQLSIPSARVRARPMC